MSLDRLILALALVLVFAVLAIALWVG